MTRKGFGSCAIEYGASCSKGSEFNVKVHEHAQKVRHDVIHAAYGPIDLVKMSVVKQLGLEYVQRPGR